MTLKQQAEKEREELNGEQFYQEFRNEGWTHQEARTLAFKKVELKLQSKS